MVEYKINITKRTEGKSGFIVHRLERDLYRDIPNIPGVISYLFTLPDEDLALKPKYVHIKQKDINIFEAVRKGILERELEI